MRFNASVDELDKVLAYVESNLENNSVSMGVSMAYLVAVEEIFVNIASYAYGGSEGYADVEFEIADGVAKTTFIDEGVEFNPLEKPDPDVTASAEERGIGGLGIYMVKKSMDGVNYERKDNLNIFSFWKNI